jgi:hypothetical protein
MPSWQYMTRWEVGAVTIRMSSAFTTAGGGLDLAAWKANVTAGVSVGRCDGCGAAAFGEPVTRTHHKAGVRVWASMRCSNPTCGAEAGRPFVAAA